MLFLIHDDDDDDDDDDNNNDNDDINYLPNAIHHKGTKSLRPNIRGTPCEYYPIISEVDILNP